MGSNNVFISKNSYCIPKVARRLTSCSLWVLNPWCTYFVLNTQRVAACSISLLPVAWAPCVLWTIGNRLRASLWQAWVDRKHTFAPFPPTTAPWYPLDLTHQLSGICSICPSKSSLQSSLFSKYQESDLHRKPDSFAIWLWLALANRGTVKGS